MYLIILYVSYIVHISYNFEEGTQKAIQMMSYEQSKKKCVHLNYENNFFVNDIKTKWIEKKCKSLMDE